MDPRKAELVKLRYFVGMSFEEAAAALGIAVPTAKQWWAYARAWLTRVQMAAGGLRPPVAEHSQFRLGPGIRPCCPSAHAWPTSGRFRLDMGEAGAGRRIGNADQMVAGRTLNLAAGELWFALQRLIAVRTIEFEFGGAHRLQSPSCANPAAKSISKFYSYFSAGECACRIE